MKRNASSITSSNNLHDAAKKVKVNRSRPKWFESSDRCGEKTENKH